MANRFKVGDIIYIEKCSEPCNDKNFCIGSLRKVCDTFKDYDSKKKYGDVYCYYFEYFDRNDNEVECYTIAREARRATNREEFLYRIYGPMRLKEK